MITILETPELYDCVNSSTYFKVGSTSASSPDMRFIFKLYVYNTANTEFTQVSYNDPYSELNGTQLFNPSPILKNYIGSDISVLNTLTGATNTPNSILKYKLEFGESYSITGLTFTSVTNNAGYIQLNYSNSLYSFTANDQLKIITDTNKYNDSYNGLCTALSSTSNSVTVNKAYNSTDTGQITYQLTIQSSFEGYMLNFPRQFSERTLSIMGRYSLSGLTSRFLTNRLNSIKLQTDQSYQLSCLRTNSAITPSYITVVTTTDGTINGDIYLLPITVNSDWKRFDVMVGPKNIDLNSVGGFSGVLQPILNDHVVSYSILLMDSSFNPISQSKEFILDRECRTTINIRFLFLGRRGGYEVVNYQQQTARKVKVDKNTINKVLPYNYSQSDVGIKNIGIELEEEITGITDFIDKNESRIHEELISSPIVYWLIEDANILQAVQILTDEFNSVINEDEPISFPIKFRFSNSERVI